jgi:cobalt-zinc-cadmium resistance protein CzcA
MKQEEQNINYFKTAALQEADALLQNAQVEFKESETDISQFVQSINSAYDIHRNYIETVYNYNIAVIELELYTE